MPNKQTIDLTERQERLLLEMILNEKDGMSYVDERYDEICDLEIIFRKMVPDGNEAIEQSDDNELVYCIATQTIVPRFKQPPTIITKYVKFNESDHIDIWWHRHEADAECAKLNSSAGTTWFVVPRLIKDLRHNNG